nr:MAG TPA: hypothetical protein [Caudoviricetes sp.]
MYALYKSSTSNNQMFHVKHFENKNCCPNGITGRMEK